VTGGSGESPAGLDLAALTTWLDAEHPDLRQGPLRASLLTGGLSNLTYRLEDDVSRWALRRPPLGHALPTAHDMPREFRIISGLHGSAVPVAPPVVLCEDADVLGAPFYVMGFVDGVVLDRADVLARLDAEAARRSCDLLIDTLLALHALRPDEVGLGALGRPDGFLERQVRRWATQWESSVTEDRPAVRALLERLGSDIPAQSASGIVHGDYRLTNVMYAEDLGSVAAVVDWEMATLGDPLTDVGLLVVYQELATSGSFVMPRLGTEAGFLDAAQMVDRYAAGSSRDLGRLSWYVAFGWFKLAVIAEGIHNRYLQGKTVGPGFDRIGASVPLLLDSGLTALSGPYDRS
jgi:aminoglycoside phosphotransferase (APT) family kinase protein